MRRRLIPIPIPLVVLAFGVAFAQADPEDGKIYNCPDASGEIVYQLGPCDAPQPNRKPPPKAETKGQAPKPKSTTMVSAKATQPGPVRTTSARPSAPTPQRAVPASTSKRSTKQQGIKPVIDPRMFTADPHWGSPERTLKTYIAAMKAGDRKLARACLVAGALDEMGPRIDAMPPDALGATVEGYGRYVLEGDLGPYWSIRALHPGARPSYIFFERASDGTWKIAAI